MDAMSEHGFRREESALFIDVGVIPCRHVEMVHLFELFPILGQVGLKISVEARRHLARTPH